jgi:hypothetical protein
MGAFRELIPVLFGLPEGTKPKTDDEIAEMAKSEWLDILRSLWVAIGKPVDQERIKIYARTFGDVPMGLLEKAVKRVQLTTTYQVVPTIAEIHKAIKFELHEANCGDVNGWIDREWTKCVG